MKSKLDKLGMAVSIGCAIHCILMPVVLPLLPMLGFVFGHDSWFHLVLSAVIVVIAAVALVPGYRYHRSSGPLTFASVGIVIIIAMGIFEHFFHSPLIIIGTIIGSTNIIIGHYLNHKYKCSCSHHHHYKDH